MDFQLWSDALLYPRDTFRAERENASMGEAIKNVGIAGLIYGAVAGLLCDIFPSTQNLFFLGFLKNLLNEYSLFSSMFLFPLIFLFLLFLASSILFLAAKILGGYGNFKTQTYLLSSLFAPLILSGLLTLIPVIGGIMILFLLLYIVKPVTLALRETHKYDKKASISTLSLSLVIVLGLIAILTLLLLQLNFSVGGLGRIEQSKVGFRHIIINSKVQYQQGGSLEFEIRNTLEEPVIITDLIPKGDCTGGKVDLNKETSKREAFIILPPEETRQIKVSHCKKKFLLKNLIKSKFSVPLQFKYQEKKIGKSQVNLERGIVEGMVG